MKKFKLKGKKLIYKHFKELFNQGHKDGRSFTLLSNTNLPTQALEYRLHFIEDETK